MRRVPSDESGVREPSRVSDLCQIRLTIVAYPKHNARSHKPRSHRVPTAL